MIKTYKASKNGETLKYLVTVGKPESAEMIEIHAAIRFLQNNSMAVSVVTDSGWEVSAQ